MSLLDVVIFGVVLAALAVGIKIGRSLERRGK